MLCNKCKLEKVITDFSFKNRVAGVRKTICKSCHSLYRKAHYLENKEKYILKAHKWNTKQKEILSQFIYDRLSKSECIDCREKDIIVLEFDHQNNKKLGIAEMYKNKYSIEAELNKCVVRCANCHRRKTAKAIGYWKLKMLET